MSDKRRRRIDNSDESGHSDSEDTDSKNGADDIDQEKDEGVVSVSVFVSSEPTFIGWAETAASGNIQCFITSGVHIANIYGISFTDKFAAT